jgi:GDP-L-fucose synthase
MKKLITGGTGLVGSSFKDGIKVGSSVNLCNYDDAYDLIKNEKPDVVIHAAAFVGGLGANIKYPANFFTKNMQMNTNVIDACHRLGVERLVCFLSTCIFPDKIDYHLQEDKVHLGPPHESNYAYAYAKRMAEVQIKAYNHQYGTKYFCVTPSNIYGKNDNFNLENAHVIPTLIHKCYLAKKNNTCFEIWGSGNPLREFIYSSDVADVIDLLIEKNKNNESVIISNSKEYTIKQIAMLIAQLMNYDGPIIWQKEKPDGQLRKPSDNSRLMRIIGDYNFTTIEIGLKKTIEWFLEKYPNIRL